MQIDTPTNRLDSDLQTITLLDSSNEVQPTDNSGNLSIEIREDDDGDTLVNIDNQRDARQLEHISETIVDIETVLPTPVEIDLISPTSKSEEFVILEVESNKQIDTKQETIDTSLPLVRTPVLPEVEQLAVQDYASSNILENPVVEDIIESETCKTSFTEKVDLKNTVLGTAIADEVTNSLSVGDLPVSEINTDPNQLKLAVNGNSNETTVPVKTAKSVSTTKTMVAKPSTKVPPPHNADKKGTTVSSKPNAEPNKLVSTAKKTVRKTTVATAQTTTTSGTKQPHTAYKSSTAAVTRSNITNKPVTEKKTSGVMKKPATVANNDDPKSTVSTKKVPVTTLKSVSTKSTSTSGIINTRPSSTATKTVAPTKLVASTTVRPTSSPSGKTSTVSTSSAGKPRTIPNKTTGKVTSTSTTTTATANKSSSSIQATASKHTVTSKISSITSRTNPATNRAPVATSRLSTTTNRASTTTNRPLSTIKTSDATVGSQRKSSTTPSKKPISSPALKTTSSKCSNSNKTMHVSKITSENCLETNPPENDTKNQLDFDKQLKNDCNQLITKNGIDSQMIVIDSAAD